MPTSSPTSSEIFRKAHDQTGIQGFVWGQEGRRRGKGKRMEVGPGEKRAKAEQHEQRQRQRRSILVPAGGRRVHQCVSELKPTLMRPFFSVVS